MQPAWVSRICERAPVRTIEPTNRGVVVQLTSGASVRARKVVMCTNAYTSTIVVPSRPRASVVRNYMLATEPLDEDTVKRLGSGQVFVVELNKDYVFYRLHRDRLVYGGVEFLFPRQIR